MPLYPDSTAFIAPVSRKEVQLPDQISSNSVTVVSSLPCITRHEGSFLDMSAHLGGDSPTKAIMVSQAHKQEADAMESSMAPSRVVDFGEDLGNDSEPRSPELTEISAAASIRLVNQAQELQDMMRIWNDFKMLEIEGPSSDYLARCYISEILSSWRSLQRAYIQLTWMRSNGSGTPQPLHVETEIAKLVAKVADWRNTNMPPRQRQFQHQFFCRQDLSSQDENTMFRSSSLQMPHKRASHFRPRGPPQSLNHGRDHNRQPLQNSYHKTLNRDRGHLHSFLDERSACLDGKSIGYNGRSVGLRSSDLRAVSLPGSMQPQQSLQSQMSANSTPSKNGSTSSQSSNSSIPVSGALSTAVIGDSAAVTHNGGIKGGSISPAGSDASQGSRKFQALDLVKTISESLASLSLERKHMQKDIMTIRKELLEAQARWLEKHPIGLHVN